MYALGVMIVVWPLMGTGTHGPGAALGAACVPASALFAAIAQVLIRRMVDTEETSAIVFWFAVSGAVLSLATLPFGWVTPEPRVAAMLVLVGLMGGVGQVCLTAAYRFADAGLIAPFD